jgi:hypothetical protein
MTLILLAFAFAIGYTSGYLDGRRRGRLEGTLDEAKRQRTYFTTRSTR